MLNSIVGGPSRESSWASSTQNESKDKGTYCLGINVEIGLVILDSPESRLSLSVRNIAYNTDQLRELRWTDCLQAHLLKHYLLSQELPAAVHLSLERLCKIGQSCMWRRCPVECHVH